MLDANARQQFLEETATLLQREGVTDGALQTLLERLLAATDCATGTIHSLDEKSGLLRLRAQRGIPEHLLERVQQFPIGKGMGGLAAERRQPVQVCNLQTDNSGVARPAAKETRMEGSIACPMMTGDTLRGVLGVAKPVPYTFSDEETAFLLAVGGRVAEVLGRQEAAS